MRIDIYTSATNSGKYLSVKAGHDIAAINNIADPDYKTVIPRKLGIDISPNQSRVGIDAAEAIAAIETSGYYIHGASARFTEN